MTISSEINLLADESLWENNHFQPGLLRVSPRTPPIWRPRPSEGIPKQIALLLCKFVQAINSISLGVAIWQQEWLESWTTRCLSLGTEMRVELQWSLKLCVIVTSLCSSPLFSIYPFLPVHVCPLYSILWRCGNKVWLLETKPKGTCAEWEARNSSCPVFY